MKTETKAVNLISKETVFATKEEIELILKHQINSFKKDDERCFPDNKSIENGDDEIDMYNDYKKSLVYAIKTILKFTTNEVTIFDTFYIFKDESYNNHTVLRVPLEYKNEEFSDITNVEILNHN